MPHLQLSDHFTYGRLLRFTWPSILMMVFTSVYGVVDGVMVSNFVGTTPFAALNLIWPYIAILGSVGFMLGTGGSALVAKTLGEGFRDKARRLFSMLTYVSILVGAVLGAVGYGTVRPMALLLGAEGEMEELSVEYGRILFLFLPVYLLQLFFQSLLVVAEKPKMGMWVTVGGGRAQHGARRALHRRVPLGPARCRLGHGSQPARRRRHPPGLLPLQPQEPPATGAHVS